jgi:hypothetical protein
VTALEHGVEDGSVEERPDRGLWVGLVIGAPVVAFGIVGLVQHSSVSRVWSVGFWAGGLLALHDAVIVPIVLAVVWAIGRIVPAAYRAPVRFAVLGTALAVTLAWPGLRMLGNPSHNPTVYPLDYGAALAWVVAAVWSTALVWAAVSATRARSSSAPR